MPVDVEFSESELKQARENLEKISNSINETKEGLNKHRRKLSEFFKRVCHLNNRT